MQAEDDDDPLLFREEEVIDEAAEQLILTNEDNAVVVYKLSRGQAQIEVRELRSKGLSFQIWPAAHALCSYLEQSFGHSGMLTTPSSHVPTSQQHSLCRNMRVLELGAGTGMVGILCAVLGAHTTITDLPHVISNLEHNANLNRDIIESSGLGGSVTVKMLRWGEQADVEGIIGGSFDLIVASDVVYYDHLFEPLLCTLKWLLLAPPCRNVGMGMDFEDVVEQKTTRKISNRNGICTSSNAMEGEEGASLHVPAMKAIVSSSLSDGEILASSEKVCDTGVTNGPPVVTKDVVWTSGGEEMSPVVLLAHLRRWKKDNQFFKKASKLFQVTVVHKYLHDANSRTGVTVYLFSRKRN